MTLSVTIYFPAHCSHTGSPDWGDVPQGRLWVESRPLRLRPCAVLQSCGPVPFAVTSSSDSLITTQQQNIVRTCPSDSVKGRDLHVEGTPGEVHHRTLRRFFAHNKHNRCIYSRKQGNMNWFFRHWRIFMQYFNLQISAQDNSHRIHTIELDMMHAVNLSGKKLHKGDCSRLCV